MASHISQPSEPSFPVIPLGGETELAVVFLQDMADFEHARRRKRSARELWESARDHYGLFLELAQVEPTPEGVRRFRKRFEDLPVRGMSLIVDSGTRHVLDRFVKSRPQLPDDSSLLEATLDMRMCVNLWRLLDHPLSQRFAMEDEPERTELKNHVRWQKGGDNGLCVVYDSHPGLDAKQKVPPPDTRIVKVIASKSMCPDLWWQFRSDDPVIPTISYLQRVVNQYLQDTTIPRLLWDRAQKRMKMFKWIIPKTLLAAIWLQFQEAILGNEKYEKCKECGRWLGVFAAGARIDRQYCSASCKVKAHRRRKEKALQLHEQGMKAKKIAEEVGSDEDTVKGWISASERE
jgi:hypothetical protein